MVRNQRGSTTVEQVFSMGTLIGVVAALLFLAAVGASKIWLKYAGNEAAICLASDAAQSDCETDFRHRTEILERIGHMRNFHLSVTPTTASVEWHFEVRGYNQTLLDLDGSVNLKLPLQPQPRSFA